MLWYDYQIMAQLVVSMKIDIMMLLVLVSLYLCMILIHRILLNNTICRNDLFGSSFYWNLINIIDDDTGLNRFCVGSSCDCCCNWKWYELINGHSIFVNAMLFVSNCECVCWVLLRIVNILTLIMYLLLLYVHNRLRWF